MNSVPNCAHASRDESDKCASAREVGRRHLAHRPDDHGKRHNGDERDRDDALEPLVAENLPIPLIARCECEARHMLEQVVSSITNPLDLWMVGMQQGRLIVAMYGRPVRLRRLTMLPNAPFNRLNIYPRA